MFDHKQKQALINKKEKIRILRRFCRQLVVVVRVASSFTRDTIEDTRNTFFDTNNHTLTQNTSRDHQKTKSVSTYKILLVTYFFVNSHCR